MSKDIPEIDDLTRGINDSELIISVPLKSGRIKY